LAKKDEKSKRKPNTIARFWRETIGELRKVSWPSRPEAMNLTKIVLVVMTVMSLFLYLIDSIASDLLALAFGV